MDFTRWLLIEIEELYNLQSPNSEMIVTKMIYWSILNAENATVWNKKNNKKTIKFKQNKKLHLTVALDYNLITPSHFVSCIDSNYNISDQEGKYHIQHWNPSNEICC